MPVTQGLSTLTKTVATLFGNIFAVIEKEEVIAAAKPRASIDLITKHKEMKADPAGTRSSNLQEKNESIHSVPNRNKHRKTEMIQAVSSVEQCEI